MNFSMSIRSAHTQPLLLTPAVRYVSSNYVLVNGLHVYAELSPGAISVFQNGTAGICFSLDKTLTKAPDAKESMYGSQSRPQAQF